MYHVRNNLTNLVVSTFGKSYVPKCFPLLFSNSLICPDMEFICLFSQIFQVFGNPDVCRCIHSFMHSCSHNKTNKYLSSVLVNFYNCNAFVQKIIGHLFPNKN